MVNVAPALALWLQQGSQELLLTVFRDRQKLCISFSEAYQPSFAPRSAPSLLAAWA